jgi:eukaryotic-like serine/threonine-protein kinase
MRTLGLEFPDTLFTRAPHAAELLSPPHRSRKASLAGLLKPGAIIDKYRVDELLGVGGFAAVYRATHILLHSTVAIKHLRPDVGLRYPNISSQFIREAQWAARVRHPSVVRIFDVGEAPGLTYLVMEYLQGGTLSQAIHDRRVPIDELLCIALDVCDGLDAALAVGLVHRDVKPANILLGIDGHACLVDFGLARPMESNRLPRQGRHGHVVGTRGYAAPEQVEDASQVDFRADIYALGISLAEGLKGRRAPPLEQLIDRMTQTAPSERPASYRDLRHSLKAVRRRLLE